MHNTFSDGSQENRHRRVTKMTYTPNMTADEVILSNFPKKDRGGSASLFPMLHRPVSQQKQYQYRERNRIAIPKPPKPKVPNAAPPFFPGAEGVPQPLLESPRSIARVEQRQAAAERIVSSAPIPPNLKHMFNVLKVYMDNEGNLSATSFRHALAALGFRISETDLQSRIQSLPPDHPVQELFSIFDARNKGLAPVSKVIQAANAVINGAEKDRVRRACFNLFDHDGRGCIHKAHLDELKFVKMDIERDTERTAEMVKVLSDLFQEELRIEEEEYVAQVFKGKGKKQKKAPPLKPMQKSLIPVGRMRVAHIDFPRFCQYFEKHLTLATIFAPCWLQLLIKDGTLRHQVVMSTIEEMRSTIAAEEQQREKAAHQSSAEGAAA